MANLTRSMRRILNKRSRCLSLFFQIRLIKLYFIKFFANLNWTHWQIPLFTEACSDVLLFPNGGFHDIQNKYLK